MKSITQTNSIILNLIRFICSQGVVLGHLKHFYNFENQFLNEIASYCVLIFFILSGFLISYSLQNNVLKKQDYHFKSFLADRFFRIFPPFLGSLFLVFVLDFFGCFFSNEKFFFILYCKNLIINAFQLQEYPLAIILYKNFNINFFHFPFLGSNLPLWTIAIEWWLYLFYGYLFFYIIKSNNIKGLNFIVLIFLSITPIYYLLFKKYMDNGLTLFWFLGTLITPLLINNKLHNKLNTTSFSLVLMLLFIGLFGFTIFGYNVSALLFLIALFILIAFNDQENKFINMYLSVIAIFFASFSYSLYLIHYSILFFIFKIFKPEFSIVTFLSLLFVVNILSFLFAQFFEIKLKNLKSIYENYRRNNNKF